MRLNVQFREQNETFQGVMESDETVKVGFSQVETSTEVINNYNDLINKPQINSVTLEGDVPLTDLGLRGIYYDTKANWDANSTLIAEEGAIYIYKDYQIIYDDHGNPSFIPGVKIGDGTSYLIDMPYVSDAMASELLSHINNTDIHITPVERTFWNSKVSSFIDHEDGENLVLSKTMFEHNGVLIGY